MRFKLTRISLKTPSRPYSVNARDARLRPRVPMTLLIAASLSCHGALADIVVANEADAPIVSIELSEDSGETWRNNELRGSAVLPGGEYSVVTSHIAVDCELSLRVSTINGSPVIFGGLCQTDTVRFRLSPSNPAGQGSFTVMNKTDFTVWTIQASPTETPTWGSDQLQGDTLAPESERSFDLEIDDGQCEYDIRAITNFAEPFYLAKQYVFKEVNICEPDVYVELKKPNRQSFLAVNERDTDILRMYVFPSGKIDTYLDRLGLTILGSESTIWIDMEGGFSVDDCHFDIAVTDSWDEDPTIVHRNIDVCNDKIVIFRATDGSENDDRGLPYVPGNPEDRTTLQSIVGTAFAISPHHLITNYHVIEECKQVQIGTVSGGDTQRRDVEIGGTDKDRDLAILVIRDAQEDSMADFAQFRRRDEPVQLGEEIVILGFPRSDMMSPYGIASKGIVGATSGNRGDPTTYQLMAPVQPGNSGSPILDSQGHIVGMVVSTSPEYQNVSYGIKDLTVQSFLQSERVRLPPFNDVVRSEVLSTPELVRVAQSFTFPVICSNRG